MKQEFEIADEAHEVAIVRSSRGMTVELGGQSHQARLRDLGNGEYLVEVDGTAHRVWLAVKGDMTYVHSGGANWSVRRVDPLDKLSAAGGGAGEDTVNAPMPGTVMRVEVNPGDEVHRGQTLIVIESMKLETAINAWRDGVVATVHQAPGSTFDRKAPLVTLESESPG